MKTPEQKIEELEDKVGFLVEAIDMLVKSLRARDENNFADASKYLAMAHLKMTAAGFTE